MAQPAPRGDPHQQAESRGRPRSPARGHAERHSHALHDPSHAIGQVPGGAVRGHSRFRVAQGAENVSRPARHRARKPQEGPRPVHRQRGAHLRGAQRRAALRPRKTPQPAPDQAQRTPARYRRFFVSRPRAHGAAKAPDALPPACRKNPRPDSADAVPLGGRRRARP